MYAVNFSVYGGIGGPVFDEPPKPTVPAPPTQPINIPPPRRTEANRDLFEEHPYTRMHNSPENKARLAEQRANYSEHIRLHPEDIYRPVDIHNPSLLDELKDFLKRLF